MSILISFFFQTLIKICVLFPRQAMTADLAFEIISFMGQLENGDKLSKDEKLALAEAASTSAKSIKFDGDLHSITLA